MNARTIRAGDAPVSLRLDVGQVLSVTAPAGSSVLVQDASDFVPSSTVSGSTGRFGPYDEAKSLTLFCSAGAGGFQFLDRVDDVMTLDESGTEIIVPERAAAVVGAAGVVGSTPSGEYYAALRAPQTGNGSPLDQSGRLNDPAVNTVLFPPTWQASTAYALGAYRSPSSPTGVLYKCTTAGTSGSSEPTWTTTLGATVSDGTAVWTAELGPWPTSASGYRHLASLQQASLPGAGSYDLGSVTWDLANGDSFILRIRQAWHADNDSRNNLTETSVMGSRHASTNRRGIQVLGTGGNYLDLKFFISDGTNVIGSGHVGDGQAGRPNFSRKPLDGNVRETCFMVDGITKTTYCFGDGVAYSQSEMYGAGEFNPNNRSLSSVTGSTQSPNNFLIGGIPGSGTTADFGVIMFDLIILSGRALPANIQAIADFFNQRGASGALLPASLLV